MTIPYPQNVIGVGTPSTKKRNHRGFLTDGTALVGNTDGR